MSDSNRPPEACKATALPDELMPHTRIIFATEEGRVPFDTRGFIGIENPQLFGSNGETRTLKAITAGGF